MVAFAKKVETYNVSPKSSEIKVKTSSSSFPQEPWTCLRTIAKGRRGKILLCSLNSAYNVGGVTKVEHNGFRCQIVPDKTYPSFCIVKAINNADQRIQAKLQSEISIMKRLASTSTSGKGHTNLVLLLGVAVSITDSLPNYYLALQPLLGGCLFDHIRKSNVQDWRKRQWQTTSNSCLTPMSVKFYAAEIANAIIYMHSRNVVHRDIKSSNVVLDAQGHSVLIDFEFAAEMPVKTDFFGRKKPHGRLAAVCGSLYYLAPEVLQSAGFKAGEGKVNAGYGFGVDWWALGVLCYEMMTGVFPFMHGVKPNENVTAEVLQKIAKSDLKKSFALNIELLLPCATLGGQRFVKELLTFENERLNVRGNTAITQHCWWRESEGMFWEQVVSGQMKAPPFDIGLGDMDAIMGANEDNLCSAVQHLKGAH
jgi:serine/threonine protein kinase